MRPHRRDLVPGAVSGGLLAVVMMLLTAACGSADESSASSAAPTASSSASPSPSPSPSSSPSSSPSPSEAAAASTGASTAATTITISDFAYDVAGAAAPGSVVMVRNQDKEAHTVTADDKGGFDVKVDPGATVMLRAPSEPGSYPFHCTYHSNMEGTLTVG